MTPPRACAACGARLSPHVTWCLRCYAPVRLLTPRAPQLHPLKEVEEPPPWVRRSPLRDADVHRVHSRWHAGPTTFGVWGRILLTALVTFFFPWGPMTVATILWTPVYLILAGLVLRSIWRKEAIVLTSEQLETQLPDPRTISTLRIATGAVGVTLLAVGFTAGGGSPIPLLPAFPFLIAPLVGSVWDPVVGLITAIRARPVGMLVAVNALNVADIALSGFSIGTGIAAELNPLIAAFGYPLKLVIVPVCSWLLYRKRPDALVWPVLAMFGLTAYHLVGLLVISLGG